jgi:purine catabolism regulator
MKREMGISVREAIENNLLGNVTVAAGEKGLDRIITRVNIMEVPDILNWVKEGELLLTTVYSIKDDLKAQERLIPELNRRNLAAIGIKPGRYIQDIPPVMLEAANKLDFPLLKLPYEMPFPDIMMPVLDEIFNRQSAFFQRMDDAHRHLMEAVLTGGDLKDIATVLSEIINNPVAIKDDVLGTMAKSTMFDDELFDDYLAFDPAREHPIKVVDRFEYYRCELKSNRISRIILPVIADGKTYGRIFAWEKNSALRGLDFSILERGATIAALYMLKERSILEVETRHKNEFVDDLLSRDSAQKQSAIERGAFFGYDPQKRYVIIAMEIKGLEKTLFAELDEIDKTRIKNRIIRIIDEITATNGKKTIVGVKSENMIILLPVEKDEPNLKQHICRMGQEIVNRITQEIKGISVMLGIGRFYMDPADLYKSYQDARRAIAVGPGITNRSVVHFDDLGVYRLLYQQADQEELLKFYRDFIEPLEIYDIKHGTELIKTLEAYFECNGNLKKISQELYTHYNTVLYRIQRIQEIVGINLDDPRDRLNMEMALRVQKVIGR